MQRDSELFVGLDTSKLKISVALAEEGRQGEIRFLGDIDNTPAVVRRLITNLSGKYRKLLFCYEAGPTGLWFASADHGSRPGAGSSLRYCIVAGRVRLLCQAQDRWHRRYRSKRCADLLALPVACRVWPSDG